MSAVALADRLEARGLSLDVAGSTLWVRPVSALDDSDREAIRANKAALIEIVKFREAARAGRVAPNHICVDTELMTRWCAAEVATGEALTIEGYRIGEAASGALIGADLERQVA
jgi:hypothetical protein